MSTGGKKDAPYIAAMFEDELTEDDPDKMPLSSGVDGDGPPRLP